MLTLRKVVASRVILLTVTLTQQEIDALTASASRANKPWEDYLPFLAHMVVGQAIAKEAKASAKNNAL